MIDNGNFLTVGIYKKWGLLVIHRHQSNVFWEPLWEVVTYFLLDNGGIYFEMSIMEPIESGKTFGHGTMETYCKATFKNLNISIMGTDQ